MVAISPLRALLFVPANRPERFKKASDAAPDAVILDLEDAVPEADKNNARNALRADFTDRPVIVRINPVGTPWHHEDLQRVSALRPAAVMVPKSETPMSLDEIGRAIGDIPILALVETARGIANARAIASLARVSQLVFGSVDYCADLGMAHERTALLSARSELVLASRLGGLVAPIDGVTTQFGDMNELLGDAEHARSLGMSGKLCIHPNQVSPVKAAFSPSETEIDWARRVLAAGDGAVAVDGEMVDAPVRQKAHTILALTEINDR